MDERDWNRKMSTHSLKRNGPKGKPCDWKCVKCNKVGKLGAMMADDCPVTSSTEDDLLKALEGNQ